MWAKAAPASLRRRSGVVQPSAAIWSRISRILRGAGGDGREGVILGRRADHRRPADVDVLDRLVERHARPGDRGLERIQIDHHQLEGEDAVLGQGLHVVGIIVPAEDAAVDLGVQRLEPAVHHLGKAGIVGDVADRNALAPPNACACRRC